jgi:hypothetical protein
MGIIKTIMVTFDSRTLDDDGDAMDNCTPKEFVNEIDIVESEISVAYSSYRVCPLRTTKSGGDVEIDTTTVIMKTGHRFILDISKSEFDELRKSCRIF